MTRPGAQHYSRLEQGREDWEWDALCKGEDPEMFFPLRRQHMMPWAIEEAEQPAKDVCRRCPVQRECLDFALRTRQPFGIWGGLNETERKQKLRRV